MLGHTNTTFYLTKALTHKCDNF